MNPWQLSTYFLYDNISTNIETGSLTLPFIQQIQKVGSLLFGIHQLSPQTTLEHDNTGIQMLVDHNQYPLLHVNNRHHEQ